LEFTCVDISSNGPDAAGIQVSYFEMGLSLAVPEWSNLGRSKSDPRRSDCPRFCRNKSDHSKLLIVLL
jgi:hypothetical protein